MRRPRPRAQTKVVIEPMRVKVTDQRSFEKALRRFKRECIREGIMADMRKSEFYDKPSVKRRRKANRARRRRLRMIAEIQGD